MNSDSLSLTGPDSGGTEDNTVLHTGIATSVRKKSMILRSCCSRESFVVAN